MVVLPGERVCFSGEGVLFRWCFSILGGTAEIFLGGEAFVWLFWAERLPAARS